MSGNFIRTAEPEDVFVIAKNLRDMDKLEILKDDDNACFHDVLAESWDASQECYTGVFNGAPVCIFGISAVDVEMHDVTFRPVWFLATSMFDQNQRLKAAFIRRSRFWVDYFYDTYGPIGNSIWNKNKESCKWLLRMGFVTVGCFKVSSGDRFITMVKQHK